MKFIRLISALFMLVLIAPSAMAACDGFYVGLQGGSARTHYDKYYRPLGVVASENESNRGPVGRIFWGYQWTRCAAIELGYARLKYRHSCDRPVASNYGNLWGITQQNEAMTDLVFKGTLPLGCRAGLFGKVGAAYRSIDFRHAHDRSRAAPTYGAGLSFDLCPKVPLEVAWTQVRSNGNLGTVNMVTLGVSYHFG